MKYTIGSQGAAQGNRNTRNKYTIGDLPTIDETNKKYTIGAQPSQNNVVASSMPKTTQQPQTRSLTFGEKTKYFLSDLKILKDTAEAQQIDQARVNQDKQIANEYQQSEQKDINTAQNGNPFSKFTSRVNRVAVGNAPIETGKSNKVMDKVADITGGAINMLGNPTLGINELNAVGSKIGNKVEHKVMQKFAGQTGAKALSKVSNIVVDGAITSAPISTMQGASEGLKGKDLANKVIGDTAGNIAFMGAIHGAGAVGSKVLKKVLSKKATPVEAKKPLALPEGEPSQFEKQVDDWKNGKLPSGNRIVVGNTPQSLRNVGAKNHDLIMNQRTLKKLLSDEEVIRNGHELGQNVVKDLPNQYEKPVMILESEQNPNSLIVLTDKFDKNNNPVISVVKLNENDGVKDINRVATAYGKNDIDNFIGKHIQQNKLLDIDNKKSQDWLLSRGLQLPKAMTSLDSTKSISQNLEGVNSNLKNSSSAVDEVASTVRLENKAKNKAQFDNLLESSDNWKDKHPLALQRETWDRNIIDIAGPKDGQRVKEAIFDPIHSNEAERIKFLNDARAKIKGLNLTPKESELVQKVGEGKISLDEVANMSPESVKKVQNAVGEFRRFYDEIIDVANESLSRNGYRPVGKLENYFPHFEGEDPIMQGLGIKLDNVELPTDINGLTHRFKPGKNWFGNFMHREGDKTTFDAVQGFDRYVEGISKIIHHTDDIKRLRGFSKELRTKYSSPEIQKQIEQITKSDLPKDVKDSAIDELLGRDVTHLSNAVADLDEYINVLAGKKDLADRASERTWGRQIYNASNNIINRVGKNMVAVNPASWITNFIPVTQSLATTDKTSVLKALNDTMKNFLKDDGLIDKSVFMTNRRGSDAIYKGIVNKVGDTLTAPMKWIDDFSSQVVTRSKYYEGLKQGMPENLAMKRADEWAAKIMGDRSLGAQPTLFNQKSPGKRLITQFQLEVNNQLSFIFKDLPREYLKDGKTLKSIAKLSSVLTQLAIGGYIYNELYSRIVPGRRPAIDPIGLALGYYNDSNNPNKKKSDAVIDLGKGAVGQVPFVGGLVGGGRIPISAAAPDMGDITKTSAEMLAGETAVGQGMRQIGKDFSNTAYYVLPPFGGGQIKKAVEGIGAVRQGGVYKDTKDGKALQYPIESNLSNTVKSALFGKSGLKETNDYYSNNRRALSAQQTSKLLNQSGGNKKSLKELYSTILEKRQLEKQSDDRRALIKANNPGLSKKGLEMLYNSDNELTRLRYKLKDDKFKWLD